MTNYLSKQLLVILGIPLLFGMPQALHAKPMDAEAAKKIPELENVLLNVREKGQLTDQDRLVIQRNLVSGDPVLVSLAACIVAESKGDEPILCRKADDILILGKAQGMPQAFLQLMLAKKKTEDKSAAERIAAIEPFLKDANPYLRVEGAKELFKSDKRKGEEALRALLSDASIIAKGEAFRQLKKAGKAGDTVPVPMPHEGYGYLLRIIEKAGR